MKSLTNPIATTILAMLLVSCTTGTRLVSPAEINLAFRPDRNQLLLDQLRIAGYPGRFVAGTAAPETLVDSSFASRHGLSEGSNSIVMLKTGSTDRVELSIVDLSGEIDAIIGSDLLGPVVVIDYRNQLITRFPTLTGPLAGPTFSWRNVPGFPVTIDGQRTVGIVDTSVPDTLIVPASVLESRDCRRCTADVEIGGIQLEGLDVRSADVNQVRIGNRVLQHFLITIDYRGRTTTLVRR